MTMIMSYESETVVVDARGQVIDRPRRRVVGVEEDLGRGVTLALLTIPGGVFQMGSLHGHGPSEEHPQHRVRLDVFWAGRDLVTQAQWKRVMGKAAPCRFVGDSLPVENVYWHEAQTFCQRLSKMIDRRCHLPAESQWEHACRAGGGSAFHWGDTLTTDLANYCGEHVYAGEPRGLYRHTTTPAATFPPNAFGLHDMHGNLWEWCQDNWHDDYSGALGDGLSWTTRGDQALRVARGGSWHDVPGACRSAARAYFAADCGDDMVGFRVFADPD